MVVIDHRILPGEHGSEELVSRKPDHTRGERFRFGIRLPGRAGVEGHRHVSIAVQPQEDLSVLAAQRDDPLRLQEIPLHGKVLPGGFRGYLLGQDIHDPIRPLQQGAHHVVESARVCGFGCGF